MAKEPGWYERLANVRKNNPIVIGLTGRTGAGCSKVASMIQSLDKEKETRFVLETQCRQDIAFGYAYNHFKKCNLNVHLLATTDFINYHLLTKLNFEQFFELLASFEATSSNSKSIHDCKEDIKKLFVESQQNIKKKKSVVDCFRDDKALLDSGLREFKEELKRILSGYVKNFRDEVANNQNRKQANCYTFLYQEMGNRLRKTGNLLDTDIEKQQFGSNLNVLLNDINAAIGNIIAENNNRKDDSTCVVVIDAIRNPYEAIYFDKEYPNFFLFAVNKPDPNRIENLKAKSFKIEEIEDLDNQESPSGDVGIENYYKVNVKKCIEMSDVYLLNDSADKIDPSDKTYVELRKKLIRYLALITKPGIVTPTREETCMQLAFNLKANSGCLSRQVGAVITDKNLNILSQGWNANPGDQAPCNLRDINVLTNSEKLKRDDTNYSLFEKNNPDFRNFVKLHLIRNNEICDASIPYCFKDAYNCFKGDKNQVHTRTVHAEEMAFLSLKQQCDNGILFVTASPCELCSKKAYFTGIRKVYYLVPYPGIANEHILKGGEKEVQLELFQGVIGEAFSKLYTPFISHKDDLYMRYDYDLTKKVDLKQMKIQSAIDDSLYWNVDQTDFYKVQMNKKPTLFDIVQSSDKVVLKFQSDGVGKERRAEPDKRDKICPECSDNSSPDKRCIHCGFPGHGSRKEFYVSAVLNSNCRLYANRSHTYTWEKFKVVFDTEDTFRLQSMANDKFVTFDDENKICTASAEEFPVDIRSRFRFDFEKKPIEQPRPTRGSGSAVRTKKTAAKKTAVKKTAAKKTAAKKIRKRK